MMLIIKSSVKDFIFGKSRKPANTHDCSSNNFDARKFAMSFVMPIGITNDNCPKPNNSNIQITEVTPRLAATISFSGYPNPNVCQSMKQNL